MAKNGMKLNTSDLKRLEKDIEDAISTSMSNTYKYYKKETPIRGGNARNKTKYKESRDTFKISSDYDYAGRLDEGWSKQAPKGFTDPSLDYLEKQITTRFKNI